MGSSNLLPSSPSNMWSDVSRDLPSLFPRFDEEEERALQFWQSFSYFRWARVNKEALQFWQSFSSFRWARLNKEERQLSKVSRISNDILRLKVGYHERKGTELEKVMDIWSDINSLRYEEWRESLMAHFSSMLRFFTGNGIQPRTPSDHIFRDHCLALLREVDAYTDLNGVKQYLGRAQILKCSTGEASSSGRTSNIVAVGYGPTGEGSGRPGCGLSDSTIQPLVEDHVAVTIDDALAGSSFSIGTTARRNTSPGNISNSIDMGDGRRHDQAPKMKEFRNFVYWTTPLFITIQVGLLSANKRQPEVLFRSCGSLVTGATICSIGMLMLVLRGPSSRRALIFLKMMQYLIIGSLFVAAILVFTLM